MCRLHTWRGATRVASLTLCKLKELFMHSKSRSSTPRQFFCCSQLYVASTFLFSFLHFNVLCVCVYRRLLYLFNLVRFPAPLFIRLRPGKCSGWRPQLYTHCNMGSKCTSFVQGPPKKIYSTPGWRQARFFQELVVFSPVGRRLALWLRVLLLSPAALYVSLRVPYLTP